MCVSVCVCVAYEIHNDRRGGVIERVERGGWRKGESVREGGTGLAVKMMMFEWMQVQKSSGTDDSCLQRRVFPSPLLYPLLRIAEISLPNNPQRTRMRLWLRSWWRSTTIRGATFGTRCSVFGPDVVGSARAKAKRAILPRQSKLKKSICFLRVREWTDDTGSTSVSEHPSRPFSLPLPFRARFPRKGFSKQRERENGRTEGESRKEQGTGDGKDRQKDRVGGRKWMIGQGTSISGVLEVSFLSTHPFSSC